MPWRKNPTTGRPEFESPPAQPERAERVSAVSDAHNPSVSHIVNESIKSRYDAKKNPTRRPVNSGPSPDKYKDILGMALVILTTIMAWLLLNDIPHSDEAIEELAMRDDETEAITKPLSRVIANSWIGSKYGERIIQSEDYLVLIMTMFMYTRRVWPAFRAKANRMGLRNRSQKASESSNGRHGTSQSQGAARAPQAQQPVYINPAISDT